MTLADSSSSYLLFVGVDIAAASFTAASTLNGCSCERARTFPQTPDGFATFQATLATSGVEPSKTLIVLEATGSYWVTLAVTLHQAGFAVSTDWPQREYENAHGVVYGNLECCALQSSDSRALPTVAGSRQAIKGGTLRGGAKVIADSLCGGDQAPAV